MQQPGGLLRPPVQNLVASLLFAKGEKAIESLILSRINSGVRTSEVHAKAAHTGGFFIGREGIRTNFHATVRWAVAATSSKTGGRLTFRHRRKGNRIPHPFPDQLRSKDFGSSCEGHPKGWLFLLAEKGFEPISMQQPGGLLLPPVQKPVASLLFAKGEKAIESLIRSPQQAEKLEFGGESPLTMRYGLQVDILHPLGPSTGTA